MRGQIGDDLARDPEESAGRLPAGSRRPRRRRPRSGSRRRRGGRRRGRRSRPPARAVGRTGASRTCWRRAPAPGASRICSLPPKRRPADQGIGLVGIALMGEGARLRGGRRRAHVAAPGGSTGSGRARQARRSCAASPPPPRERDVADDDRRGPGPAASRGWKKSRNCSTVTASISAFSIGRQRWSLGRMTPPSSRPRPRRGRGEVQVEALDRAPAEAGEQGRVPARMDELGGEAAAIWSDRSAALVWPASTNASSSTAKARPIRRPVSSRSIAARDRDRRGPTARPARTASRARAGSATIAVTPPPKRSCTEHRAALDIRYA